MAEQLTVQKQEYNLLLKTLNLLAGAAWSLGLPGKMTADSILGSAKKQTGLSDWGDNSFRVALDELLTHMGSAPLSSLGRTNAYLSLVQAARPALPFRARAQPWTSMVAAQRPGGRVPESRVK